MRSTQPAAMRHFLTSEPKNWIPRAPRREADPDPAPAFFFTIISAVPSSRKGTLRICRAFQRFEREGLHTRRGTG